MTTQRALAELKELVDYIASDSSIDHAQKVRDGIIDIIASLETMPARNAIHRTATKKKYTYRYAPKWSYKIVYRIEEEPPTVNVVSIFHTSQHPIRLDKILE
ncbi:MAG: type II toxin-antitoxin system RelE/ParE family toxin [Saprospiraceae bacterium]